jgi:hypothetical protein
VESLALLPEVRRLDCFVVLVLRFVRELVFSLVVLLGLLYQLVVTIG